MEEVVSSSADSPVLVAAVGWDWSGNPAEEEGNKKKKKKRKRRRRSIALAEEVVSSSADYTVLAAD